MNTILISYLTFAVNKPDQQQASVDVDGSSGLDTNPSTLDKPQTCSFSDTKTIELSQSAKDDLIKGSVRDNATILSSGTTEEKNFTFEVNASSSQNLNSPMVIIFFTFVLCFSLHYNLTMLFSLTFA